MVNNILSQAGGVFNIDKCTSVRDGLSNKGH